MKNQPRLTQIPDGCGVVSDTGGLYYANGGALYKVPSQDIFDSWHFETVFTVPQRLVDTYVNGKSLGFRPGTVVGSLSDMCFYFINTAAEKQKIVSSDFFRQTGKSRWNINFVSKRDLAIHKTGEDIE